jgi:cell division septum initiation protein DivIVA
MTGTDHGEGRPIDADEIDQMIDQFRSRLDTLQQEAATLREEFDRLHQRWVAHLESRNGT